MSAYLWTMLSALKTFVSANLPTYLTEVSVSIGDFTLPVPQLHVLGYRDLLNSASYPIVGYAAASLGVRPSGSHGIWLEPEVDIGVGLTASHPDTLEKILLGYSDAFVLLFAKNESLGGLCEASELQGLDWGHGASGDKSVATLAMTIWLSKEVAT